MHGYSYINSIVFLLPLCIPILLDLLSILVVESVHVVCNVVKC